MTVCGFCLADVADELAVGWIHLGIAVATVVEPTAEEIAAGSEPEGITWRVTADFTLCSTRCFLDVAEQVTAAARRTTLTVTGADQSLPRRVRRARGHPRD